jgi:succinate-acetate transporter protein
MDKDTTPPRPLFAEPAALGLFGLAVGCAALLPSSFGYQPADPVMHLRTVAVFCLLFGAGGQFLAGLMSFANKNLLGGTLFTTFSFNWVYLWWALGSLADGKPVDPQVAFAIDVTFLVIFVPLTWAFGFFSSLFFVFLLDIDLMFAGKIAAHLLDTRALDIPIAVTVLLLILLALWLAFATVLNSAAGRTILKVPGPLFRAGPASATSASPR